MMMTSGTGRTDGRTKGTKSTVRQWQNTIAGWFGAYFVLALIVITDPLGVYQVWEDGGQGRSSILYALAFTALSLAIFEIFALPKLVLLEGRLVIHNVTREISIPYSCIENLRTTNTVHLQIQAGGKWYRALGVERSNLSAITMRPGVAGVAADRISSRPPQAGLASGRESVQVLWRHPSVSEVIIALLWVAYWVAGTIAIGRH